MKSPGSVIAFTCSETPEIPLMLAAGALILRAYSRQTGKSTARISAMETMNAAGINGVLRTDALETPPQSFP